MSETDDKDLEARIKKLEAELEEMESVPSDYQFEQVKMRTRVELLELIKKREAGIREIVDC